MPGDQGSFRGKGTGRRPAGRIRRAGVDLHYNKAKGPKAPTRPELWEGVAEVFSRTANGCGHRQIAMCLRAEKEASVANKTVLKIMHEMGISCGIRRETDYRKYNSYKGVVGETFEDLLGRDFSADGPWQKLGTDVTEFKQRWGKAYLAPAYDFGSKEIVAWSISEHPSLMQQEEMLSRCCFPRCRRAPTPSCSRTWAGSTSIKLTAMRLGVLG